MTVTKGCVMAKSATTPEPIIDKNGKATTVWKKTEPVLSAGQRLSEVAKSFSKPKGQPPLDDWVKDHLFRTVQRLRPRRQTMFRDKTGFDAEFEMEYMGASEFEFGAPKQSLTRMRKDEHGLEKLSEEFTLDGQTRTVHFVGTNLENKVAEFQGWLDDGARSQEPTSFDTNFTGNGSEVENKTSAWWSLSGDIAWTMDEDLADRLVTAITPY